MIEICFKYWRSVLAIMMFGIIAGIMSYVSIPKESVPDVKIPFVTVSLHLRGVSADDAQSLLTKPVEQKVRSIEGIKELKSQSYEGGATITIEFQAGLDVNKAYRQVLDKVDEAKSQLPDEADDPKVAEADISAVPILNIHLSGQIPDRTLYRIAKDLKDEIEAKVSTVLNVKIQGDRKEVLEILIDPVVLQSYNITVEQAINVIRRNNMLISSGAIETKGGRITVKVPGLIKTAKDLWNTPIVAKGDRVIKFKDVASVRRSFKDPQGFSRVNNVQAVTLAVSKRAGKNMLNTVAKVRGIVEQESKSWKDKINISFSQDQSDRVKEMLTSLENNVITAIILVMMVILSSMGLRSSLLVGLAIPASFLIGVWIINLLGYTFNIVVLFSLILSIGMLVDGAIIVVEDADRYMTQKVSKYNAYLNAARRMFIPVFTSITATLAVFMPLLFWPGFVGEFMKFLPITLLVTLSASLFVAIVFIPTLGSLFGAVDEAKVEQNIIAVEKLEFNKTQGLTRWYINALYWSLQRPGKVILSAIGIMITVIFAYVSLGRGVEFFPNVDPDIITIDVQGRGNLSVYEKNELVLSVEKRLMGMKDFKSITTNTSFGSKNMMIRVGDSTIGQIVLEVEDYKKRRSIFEIMADLNQRTKDVPGVIVQISKIKQGPPGERPITIEVKHYSVELLEKVIAKLRKYMEAVPQLINIEDDVPSGEIEWIYTVDRAQAQKFGLDIATVGNAIKLATNGIKVDKYRPEDSKDEIDIMVRFNKSYRNMDQIRNLNIYTKQGLIPISNFVEADYRKKLGKIYRVDGVRTHTISADVQEGVLTSQVLGPIKTWLADNQDKFPMGVKIALKGEDKDQKEAASFLSKAFMVAIIAIAIILMTQFNSVFSMLLVLSSVIMSTIGMFLGLLIMDHAFSVVMCGIGMIALSGIIVSNNILMIDTYDRLKSKVRDPMKLLLSTGAHRLRAVILTQATTSLGLLPIMLGVTINFVSGEVTYGEPSTQWWAQLATCIVFGVVFASPLTLFVTPCALMLKHRFSKD